MYIGQTCQKVQNRWRNGQGYKSCSAFYAAIKKYGWENFYHIILKEKLTLKQANYYEEYYINLYQTTNKIYGYNICKGGNNHILSDETKKKISESHRGKKCYIYGKTHSKETIEKMKKAKQGKKRQKHTNESKRKMSKSHNGYSVLCINTNQIFSTLKEASDWSNADRSNISKCCRKLRQYAGQHPITKEPLRWKYCD